MSSFELVRLPLCFGSEFCWINSADSSMVCNSVQSSYKNQLSIWGLAAVLHVCLHGDSLASHLPPTQFNCGITCSVPPCSMQGTGDLDGRSAIASSR